MNDVKELITDAELLGEWAIEIDPRKEGKLVQEIVLALKRTMREHDLVSLSAPQIGYNRRIFCIRFGKNDFRSFINPMIENNSSFHFAREKCSSLPGKEFIRPRFGNLKMYYLTPMGEVKSGKLTGRSAIVFQHCLDHLNGLLLSDVGLEIDELWDQATDEEREQVIQAYAESLDIRQKELQKEISENQELSDIEDASRFMASVKAGETQIDNSSDENSTNEE